MNRSLLVCLIAAVLFAVPACTKKADTSTSATATAAPDTASPASASTGPTPVATLAVDFTDIKGTYGENAITNLAKLGILDSTTGEFKPQSTLKRRDFIRWLIKANNTYNKNDNSKFIRLASSGPSSFADVSASDPDFQYVQGLANAGFVIGIDKNHFAPDRLLTREELLAIVVGVDLGGAANNYSSPVERSIHLNVSDVASINPRYLNPLGQQDVTGVLHRTFGNIKVLRPKQQVTREEAALAVSEVNGGSAAAALTPK